MTERHEDLLAIVPALLQAPGEWPSPPTALVDVAMKVADRLEEVRNKRSATDPVSAGVFARVLRACVSARLSTGVAIGPAVESGSAHAAELFARMKAEKPPSGRTYLT